MKRLVWLAIGMVLGGLLVTGSLKYHVLRTKDGMTLVPKREISFEDAYVDIRQFGVTEWAKHQNLMLAVVENKQTDLLENSARETVERKLGEWISSAQK
jgi:Fe-S cluster biosynthesis and repair protein YggX